MKYQRLTTPPGLFQFVILGILALGIIVGTVWATINGQTLLQQSYGFLGMYGTAILILELFTAILLFSQFRITRLYTFAFLAAAYGWVAILGSFQVGLLADIFVNIEAVTARPVDGSWLWTFWHIGFPLLVTVAMLLDGSNPVATRHFKTSAILIVLSVVCLAGYLVCATLFSWMALPTLVAQNHAFSPTLTNIVGPMVIGSCFIALAVTVIKGRFRNSLYAWLTLAMLASLCEGFVSLHSGARYSQGWYAARLLSLVSSVAVMISLLIETIKLHHKVVDQNAALARIATTDGLTNLANRRALDERIKSEVARCIRQRRPLSFIMLDIDRFKQFNDSYGHLNGDHCLEHIASIIKAHVLRGGDMAVRYGGEEFAILLPDTEEETAVQLAETLRQDMESRPISLDNGRKIKVTASFGVASLVPNFEDDATELIRIADTALYLAKASGRNKVKRPSDAWHAAREKQESKADANVTVLRHG